MCIRDRTISKQRNAAIRTESPQGSSDQSSRVHEPPRSMRPSRDVVSLETGTWLEKPRRPRGHGVFTIQNNTPLDSVVKLVTVHVPKKVFGVIYVKANDKVTMAGIGVG